jgi:spermidine synthase
MEDTPFELRKHLQFMLQARGRVLITGLGLGCVIRGCLANPAVEHVTCIENSPDVLKLVAPYMPTERLSIIEADALEWTALNREPFDCAWHDLWTDRDNGEPHLDLWHTRLIYNCRQQIKRQGAWAYSRLGKYWLRKAKIDLIG